MKRCPKCNREYSDQTLEFCLEDGARLIAAVQMKTSVETVILPNAVIQPTVANPISPTANSKVTPTTQTKVQEFKEIAVDKGYQVLEIAPIVLALIHNYWQWLYADKHNFSSFADFFLSSSFIVWLFLLIVSTALSISALKFGRYKGFAITSLIILAINFLLFIVPRR